MRKYWKEAENEPAFRYSKAVIEHHAKSFSVAAKFLPEYRRWATYAVYAFCRHADNIIDNPRNRSKGELTAELNKLRHELELAYRYGESEHPAIKAFIVAAKEFNIPADYAFDLLNGVEMDMEIRRYDNFDELYVFCYRVAAVVGLMMTYVLGFENEETLVYAEKMGIGMQLTNILRDIKEDSEMGRIYLPREEMAQFGISDRQVEKQEFSGEFRELMIFQAERAVSYYRESEPGIRMLNDNSQFAIYAAGKIYGSILDKLKSVGYNPFLGRVYVPLSEKAYILFQELAKRKIRLNIF